MRYTQHLAFHHGRFLLILQLSPLLLLDLTVLVFFLSHSLTSLQELPIIGSRWGGRRVQLIMMFTSVQREPKVCRQNQQSGRRRGQQAGPKRQQLRQRQQQQTAPSTSWPTTRSKRRSKRCPTRSSKRWSKRWSITSLLSNTKFGKLCSALVE